MRHICWDGCMFPNAVMEEQQTWNDVLGAMIKVRDAHGWREWRLGEAKASPRRGGREAATRTARGRKRSANGKELNIGMIGYGFMGRAHSNAFRSVAQLLRPRLPAGAEGRLRRATRRSAETSPTAGATRASRPTGASWSSARTSTSIDICVPNDLHAEIAIAAAKAGKMVHLREAARPHRRRGREDGRRGREGGRPQPGLVQLPPDAGGEPDQAGGRPGKLGQIFHYRAKFLQDWTISPDVPQGGAGTWRLDVEAAGSGVTGDLLAHCLDTAIWINGSIDSLTAMTETFVKERKHADTGKVQPVGIDDAAAVLARFDNGSLGTFEVDPLRPRPQGALHARDQRRARLARLGPARPATASPGSTTAIEGRLRGWTLDPRHRRRPPVPRQVVGAGPASSATSTPSCTPWPTSSTALTTGKPAAPTFRDALETTRVCDAIIASGKSGQWVNL